MQVLFQIGAAVGNAAQAGFLGSHTHATKEGEALADWTGSRNSFFFTSAVIGSSGLVFAIFFRHDQMTRTAAVDETTTAEAAREEALDAEARRSGEIPTVN